MSNGIDVEALLSDEPINFLEILGIGIVDIAVPVVSAVCLLVASLYLRKAAVVAERQSLRIFAYAFLLFFLTLALPFIVGILLLLVLEDGVDRVSETVFSLLSVIPMVLGTVLLVVGTRKLRSEANAA